MFGSLPWFGTLLLSCGNGILGPCSPYPMAGHPYFTCPRPPAPSASGPGGFYTTAGQPGGMTYGPSFCPDGSGGTFMTAPAPGGMTYGPNYNLVPPWPPFNGILPLPRPPRGCPPLTFPVHPYARGPRDFFMLEP